VLAAASFINVTWCVRAWMPCASLLACWCADGLCLMYVVLPAFCLVDDLFAANLLILQTLSSNQKLGGWETVW
jgi:hypothetical protein